VIAARGKEAGCTCCARVPGIPLHTRKTAGTWQRRRVAFEGAPPSGRSEMVVSRLSPCLSIRRTRRARHINGSRGDAFAEVHRCLGSWAHTILSEVRPRLGQWAGDRRPPHEAGRGAVCIVRRLCDVPAAAAYARGARSGHSRIGRGRHGSRLVHGQRGQRAPQLFQKVTCRRRCIVRLGTRRPAAPPSCQISNQLKSNPHVKMSAANTTIKVWAKSIHRLAANVRLPSASSHVSARRTLAQPAAAARMRLYWPSLSARVFKDHMRAKFAALI
jgi:hypothetical protein